jgi:SAM-dependent methyltransferase
MENDRELPADFLAGMHRVARCYLESSDPRLQSGFGGGPERWRAEREPILDAVERSGSLLDVGCANGFLVECLRWWGAARGLGLVPFGLDLSPDLVELARRRLPEFGSNFYVGDAWSWVPPRRFTYVYSLVDVVPPTHLGSCLHRVRREFLEPNGRLIVGSYGSVSRRIPPLDLERILPTYDLRVAGTTSAGPGGVVRFAWVDSAPD